MLKQTFVKNDLSVRVIDVPLGEIPNNLADVTELVLSMHKANGNLMWVADTMEGADTGEAHRDDAVILNSASGIIADMSRNLPEKHDVNGPGTGLWELFDFIQQTIERIIKTDERYESEETRPLKVLAEWLTRVSIEK